MSNRPEQRFRTQNIAWQARLQGVELASFRSRAFAFLFDFGLILAVLGVARHVAGTTPVVSGGSFEIDLEFSGLLGVGIAVLYFWMATYLGNGATPGKRLCGIRVVSLAHSRLSIWHCLERCLGYAASTLEAGFGFMQYFSHPNRQTVHDRIAETIVIVSRRTARQASPIVREQD